MSVKVCCDFCDKPLKYIDGRFVLYYTKELNTRKLLPHLCEKCAKGLDQMVSLAKDEWLKQIDISVRNGMINEERREKLGTNG